MAAPLEVRTLLGMWSQVVRWLPVWVPSLAAFAVAVVTLRAVMRQSCPRPTIQRPAPVLIPGHDSDGPFLVAKFRLGNPGNSTIYCNTVQLKLSGMERVTLSPQGDSNVPPEQTSSRPPFLKFKTTTPLRRSSDRSLPDSMRATVRYSFTSGPCRRIRTRRLRTTVEKRLLVEGRLLDE